MTPSYGRHQEIENPVFTCSLSLYLLLHKVVQSIITYIFFLVNDSAKHD